MPPPVNSTLPADWASRLVAAILSGPMPAMLVFMAVAVGAAALMLTPREEEPQIIVPLADVLVRAPGLSAGQVERQITIPLEKLLYQIDGVEYVYSVSRPGGSVVTVRFYVGEDREGSLVKIYNKILSNTDQVPAAVDAWVVKPVEIDDVPILIATLWSEDPERSDDHSLRRLAEELERELQAIPRTNRVQVSGGRPRQIRVELNPEALAARRTAPLEVAWAIEVSNRLRPAGTLIRDDRNFVVEAGDFIADAAELGRLVVNVVDGIPVYLADVATIIDGPAEPETYTWLAFGPADPLAASHSGHYPAVSISVAKEKGANAVWVARAVERRLAELRDDLFPPEVDYRIIRNHGQTADAKVNDLVASLLVAVLTVVVFIGIFIGWRAALVVALAIPVCYGITLGLDLLTGYTINRVTLFALILALGLLVDDPITGIDNIERYFRLQTYGPGAAVVHAMSEIRAALVMSTLAIVLSFAPLFFITGMMGPYMAPMAFNVPVAVIVSTAVAFLITPWLAYRLLPHRPAGGPAFEIARSRLYRLYGGLLRPLVASRRRAWLFLGLVAVLFFATAALPAFRVVPLKLLPYDNKNEFQVVLDLPEGSSLERTQAAALALADSLRSVPEVREVAGFVGLASPMDFNGMVRQHYLRQGPELADLRITLVEKQHRSQQSHGLLLRIRDQLEAVAEAHGALIQLVEAPPGPPVAATVVAELYGTETTPYPQLNAAAETLAARLAREPFVADVDSSVEAPRPKLQFITDKEKAALSGIATEDVARSLELAVAGRVSGYLELPTEANPLPLLLRLPLQRRSHPVDLQSLYVKGRPGIAKVRERDGVRDAPQPLVQLAEIGEFRETLVDQPIYHKNLRRVAYVFAELTGRTPAEVVLDVGADLDGRAGSRPRPLAGRTYLSLGGGDPWMLPEGVQVVWTGEGEWDITLRVFRDLGIAFGAALVGIFIVLWIQTGLAAMAGIIMVAIPLTVIGIMPGFWFLNSIGERVVAGYPNPVLFTATAMIGMIALAGIVVRNSLILIEFVHLALRQGESLAESLVQAGAIRMRPVLLTAGTTLLGNLVITLDPIFSGLAWAIIFGIAASTLFTLAVIPVVYFLVYGRAPGHGLAQERSFT